MLIILTLAALGSAIISGIAGMGGGITLLAAMILFMPVQTMVPIHGLVQLVSNSARAFFLLKSVKWKFFGYFLFAVPFGGWAGYFLLSRIESPQWILFLIVGFLLYVVFKPKKFPEIRLPFWAFAPLGLVASTLGCLIGATGPLLAPFFVRTDLTKEEMVASKAACQLAIHIVKIPVFLALDFPYKDHILLIGLMIIGVVIGTRIGTLLLGRISTKGFLKVVKGIMLVIALRLLWKLSQIYL